MKYHGCGLIIVIFFIGCGGSSKSSGGGGCCPIPGINVEVVSPTGAAAVDDNPNQTLTITVKVTNDSSNAGVTWTVAPAIKNGPTGTLSGQTALSVTFTPPTGVTSPVQVTVTATSVTDTTRSAAIPITVYPPLVAVTTSSDLTTAFFNTNYTCIQQPITSFVQQVTCLVSVAGGVGPYTWSLGASSLPLGLELAPATTPATGATSSTEIIGIPTLAGIYPFTLTATDGTGNSATFSLNINVAPNQLKVPTPTVMNVLPGQPYAPIQLQASGGIPPYNWSLAPGSPSLPQWASLSPSGVISANPPANLPPGGYSFAVQVTDSQTLVPAQGIFPAPLPVPKRHQLFFAGQHPLCVRILRLRRGWPSHFFRQFHGGRQRQSYWGGRHYPLQRSAAGTTARFRKLDLVRCHK